MDRQAAGPSGLPDGEARGACSQRREDQEGACHLIGSAGTANEEGKEQAMAAVLVIGASGGIGLETVKRALAEGHRVRALARGAAAMAVDHPALERVAGDALDGKSVAGVLHGMDAVIQ